jgi:hypothetical protein
MHRTVLTRSGAALLVSATVLAWHGAETRGTAPGPVFERDIVPILREHCWKCHGETTRKSGLDLRTLAGALRGGASGDPAVVPGKAEASPLYELISTGKMPPKKQPRPSAAHVATIRKWIDAGAAGDGPVRSASSPQEELARKVHFLLEIKCHQCHGRKRQEAALDLRTRASMLKGGKSGPAVVPGDPNGSLLVRRIADDQMPPRNVRYKLSIKPLAEPELDQVRQWVACGAHDPPPPPEFPEDVAVSDADRLWWSFRPPKRSPPPPVRGRERVRTPIDAFVLARLEAAGFTFAPEASRVTLLRRAYLDLIGLPPTPEEVDAFVHDPDPAAYERVIDRLLASPHYGERWAQHWLDAAGYSDSEGSQGTDPVYPDFYRYRDYVIRAHNSDLPYDRFLLEQLAGDELVDPVAVSGADPNTADPLIATGFLRTAIDPTISPELNFPSDRYQVLADTVEIVSSSLLGLTMRCARCHSHKYDPISQGDYYEFTALFASAYAPQEWLKPTERYLALVSAAEHEAIKAHNAAVDARIAPLKKELNALPIAFSTRIASGQAVLPLAFGYPLQVLVAARASRQTPSDVKALPAFLERSAALEAAIREAESKRRSLPKAHGLTDVDTDAPFYLLKRGEWYNRGPVVRPNVPAVLRSASFRIEKPRTGARTAGRRLALARWLTRPNHPLTARVFVNRIWQHHFGTGIVASADDFGHTGARPTHPELLDWLATEFVEKGWSVKHLHRLIMTSRAYRQESRVRLGPAAIDPENKLLWRMPLRRLDAETLRDSVLALAGRLNRGQFGPPVAAVTAKDGQVGTGPNPSDQRRSIYLLHRRSTPVSVLETFDAPRLTTNCVRRRTSIVVSQALLLLNSEFMDREAEALAERLERRAGNNLGAALDLAYRLVLSRPRSGAEHQRGLEFLRTQSAGYRSANPRRLALADFCLVLLNSAEFLYVD